MSPGEVANDQDLPMIGPELDLMAYLDGELDPVKSAEVEAKLASDPEYAARLRALVAVGSFLRDDADRIYDGLEVDDALTDQILAKTEPVPKTRSNVIPLSEIAPPTSRGTRRTKNVIIWATFGTVAAAAAGLFLYMRSNEARQQKAATANPTTTQETVAQVKTAEPPPSHKNPQPQPIAESSNAVEVEDLEVGQGATVIYTRGAGGQNAVVWINENQKH